MRSKIARAVERFEVLPRSLRIALALIWAGTIWWESSHEITGFGGGFLVAFVCNGGHLVLFGLLGALVALALGVRTRRDRVIAWSLAVAWGILDEIHQRYVPSRSSSVFDVTTDACGAAFTITTLWWLRTKQRRGPLILGAWCCLGLCSVLAATLE